VDLDARKKATDLGDNSRNQWDAREVQPMGEAVEENCMKSRIAEDDLDHALRGGIFAEDRIDLLPDSTEHSDFIIAYDAVSDLWQAFHGPYDGE
jgi:hypothetical protein